MITKEKQKAYYRLNAEKIKLRNKNRSSEISAYEKEYRKCNADKIQKTHGKYLESIKGRMVHWKSGAKRRGLEWSVTLEELESIQLICHYTGVPLTKQRHSYYTVSLDRLDSEKGYTKDNVVFCCEFINRMKQELSYDQFIRACAKIGQHCGAREFRSIITQK